MWIRIQILIWNTASHLPSAKMFISLLILYCSVLDLNRYVFGPVGSKSVIVCTDPDPYISKQNNLDKQ
jgi:hypothetical protein